jgi:hypothetical protein
MASDPRHPSRVPVAKPSKGSCRIPVGKLKKISELMHAVDGFLERDSLLFRIAAKYGLDAEFIANRRRNFSRRKGERINGTAFSKNRRTAAQMWASATSIFV